MRSLAFALVGLAVVAVFSCTDDEDRKHPHGLDSGGASGSGGETGNAEAGNPSNLPAGGVDPVNPSGGAGADMSPGASGGEPGVGGSEAAGTGGDGAGGDGPNAGGAGAGGAGGDGAAGDGAGGSPGLGGAGGVDPVGGGNGAGGAAPIVYPLSCRHILLADPAAADGDYMIDPDGDGNGDPSEDPFLAHCDMTEDDGGWTMIGLGAYWNGDNVNLDSDGVLPWGVFNALRSVSTNLYRAGGAFPERLFIHDPQAVVESVFNTEATNSDTTWVWRSFGSSVECSIDYSDVLGASMTTVSTKNIDCQSYGFGDHTCGSNNGWILLHQNDTFNTTGGNPCAQPIAVDGSAEFPTNGHLTPLYLR